MENILSTVNAVHGNQQSSVRILFKTAPCGQERILETFMKLKDPGTPVTGTEIAMCLREIYQRAQRKLLIR